MLIIYIDNTVNQDLLQNLQMIYNLKTKVLEGTLKIICFIHKDYLKRTIYIQYNNLTVKIMKQNPYKETETITHNTTTAHQVIIIIIIFKQIIFLKYILLINKSSFTKHFHRSCTCHNRCIIHLWRHHSIIRIDSASTHHTITHH